MIKLPPMPEPTPAEREARARIEEYRKAHPTPLSPCVDQTADDIAGYYRNAEIGAVAVVRHTQGGLLRYDLATIDGKKPKSGRVYVNPGGAFYMKSGANCFHPKGQTSLVVPTREVLAWIGSYPRGSSGVTIYRSTIF